MEERNLSEDLKQLEHLMTLPLGVHATQFGRREVQVEVVREGE